MYKLHLLQHPDWHRTGTSYCYFYIFEIIHHDIVFLYFLVLKIQEDFSNLSVSLWPKGEFFENLPVLPYR